MQQRVEVELVLAHHERPKGPVYTEEHRQSAANSLYLVFVRHLGNLRVQTLGGGGGGDALATSSRRGRAVATAFSGFASASPFSRDAAAALLDADCPPGLSLNINST